MAFIDWGWLAHAWCWWQYFFCFFSLSLSTRLMLARVALFLFGQAVRINDHRHDSEFS